MIRQINDDLIHIDDTVVLERGPRRLSAMATDALLSDEVTASHYQVGRPDALGKPIVLGEPMTYLDWNAFRQGVGKWYVYKLDGGIFALAGEFDTQAEAVEAGLKL